MYLIDPVSPLPVFLCLLTAMATAFLLRQKFGAPPPPKQFASIDGLRGYLALFVFLHHSCIWYFYLQTGRWVLPPSNFYTQLGHSSVFLFFMITGFLFFSKIIDARKKSLDWGRLFIGRFLRLTPLYLLFIFFLFTLIAYLTGGTLRVPAMQLAQEIANWLGFTVFGTPPLNGVGGTTLLSIAGATWSLPYEWLFYLSLPILALTAGVMPPVKYIALSIASLSVWTLYGAPIRPFILLPFLGGIAASLLARSNLFRDIAPTMPCSFIALGCIAITATAYPSALDIAPLLLLTIAFALIAGGNTLFGLLISPTSRTLGEMAYSIYLLHGVTLFVTFNLVSSTAHFKGMLPAIYWLWIIGVTPILILICFTTFHFIENPALQSTSRVTTWLRSHKFTHSRND